MPAEVDVEGIRDEAKIKCLLAARNLRNEGRDPERGQRAKDDRA